MTRLLLLSMLILSVLPGCAGLGATGMTPEQIKALAKDDAATTFCTVVSTMGVKVASTYTRVDKGSVPNGAIVLGADCSYAYQNGVKP